MRVSFAATGLKDGVSDMVALFPLGEVVATAGALAALERAKQPDTGFLDRHANGIGVRWTKAMLQRMNTA